MKFKSIGISFLLYFLFTYNLKASNPYFNNITAIDGLSSNEVYDITQDNEGYLWFATDRGLTRYDGVNFQQYTTSDGLLDNVIFNFFEQKNGTIWCSTSNNQIFYFKNFKEGFKPYINNQIILKNIPEHSVMNNIAIASNGDVILSFLNIFGYLRISDSGVVTNRLYKEEKRRKFPYLIEILKNTQNFIAIDSPNNIENFNADLRFSTDIDSNLWGVNGFSRIISFPKENKRIGFLGNYYFLVDEKNNVEQKSLFLNKKLAISAGKYNEDLFWISYQYGGVVLMDMEGNITQHYLKDKSVTKIYKDHEGGMWIATTNAGVFYT